MKHTQNNLQFVKIEKKTTIIFNTKNNRLFNLIIHFVSILVLLLSLSSCEKIVDVSPPKSKISAAEVFATKEQAESAVAGVFFRITNSTTPPHLTAGGISYYTGLSSDELLIYNLTNNDAVQFNTNSLLPNNGTLYSQLWSIPFSNLYQANAIREGLTNSPKLSPAVKSKLSSEVSIVSCLINFYLTNLYGKIPYVNETNWRVNSLLSRVPTDQIYSNITHELTAAIENLPADFIANNNQRIIPTKWAAKALLARIYLFQENFQEAEREATEVINCGLFHLVPLSEVFKPNSTEAIWQLKQDNIGYTFNATSEGATFVPPNNPNIPPPVFLSNFLLNSFDTNDQRKLTWTKEMVVAGQSYYYPYKYKIGRSQATSGGAFLEYYTIFRLAEQYLIRAEARAKLNNLEAAINDINFIRQRAGLSDLPNTLSQHEIMDFIIKERQCEYFAEWGHRWLDLKRLGIASQELSNNKNNIVTTDALLYPIPTSDLLINPNLDQNPGY